MQGEASTLRRVRTKLARLGDRLRRDEEQEGGSGEFQVPDSERDTPAPRAGVPRHLLKHILYRGGSASTTGADGEGDSCESDTEPDSAKPGRLPHLSRTSDTEYPQVSGDDNTDDETVAKSKTEAPSPLPASRGLRACGLRRPLLPPRAATLAECQSLPPTAVDEGPSSAPEVANPEGGILEKLGQRLKERSDKVHRVNICHLTLLCKQLLESAEAIKWIAYIINVLLQYFIYSVLLFPRKHRSEPHRPYFKVFF